MEKILNYANPAWYAEGSKLSGRARLIEVLDDISDKIETDISRRFGRSSRTSSQSD
jgi:hypothetical protein